MKILHVIGGLGTGGAEKLLVDSIPLISQKIGVVDLLLLNGKRTPFLEEIEKSNTCNIFSLGKSFYNPFYIFKIIPFLKKYDVIHVHLFPALYFVAIAKMISFSSTKIIFTEHNTENRRMDDIKYRLIEKLIYKSYSKIICISSKVKEKLLETLNISDDKLILIENGINISVIKNAEKYNRNAFNYKENDTILIMVAAFRKQKDQDTLIKVLNKLPSNYKLILVGDGERRSDLEKLAIQFNVSERVNFLGQRSDVYSLLKMSDIAILSSHWEGFGIAAAEAMAAGTPLIASNVDGLAQVVENGGLTFEKGNIDELLDKIKLLQGKDFYNKMSLKGMSKANSYDISLNIKQLIDIYYSLINTK